MIAILGLTLSNFVYVHKSFRTLRLFGGVGTIAFIIPVVIVFIEWGTLATLIFLLYLFVTVLAKTKILYPLLKNYVSEELKPLYNQLMLGRSSLDARSVEKRADREFKKTILEYLNSLKKG